jgi:outer membrane protein assembly factor BamB
MVLAREDGVVMVMKLLDVGFELLSENKMNERLIASPIPIGDKLYLRGQKHLFCLGG